MRENLAFPALRPELTRGLERLLETLRGYDACLGIYLWGAHSTNTADEFSDLDVAVVVRDSDYESVKSNLRSCCDSCFGTTVGWLPEGERDGIVNYAFLFESGHELLLADLLLLSEGLYRGNPTATTNCILFDRAGFLLKLAHPATPTQKALPAKQLEQCQQDYWTYMYLNGKYWKRRDTFKIVSAQEALFQRHVNLLRLLYSGPDWSGWAAKDVRQFPEQCREQLLAYSAGARFETLSSLLHQEMDSFSQDAQQACQRYGVNYCDELERRVREYLARMGAA